MKKLEHLSEIYSSYDTFVIDLWGVMHNGIVLKNKAIEAVDLTSPIILHTDSIYGQKGITEWIINWKKNNWITSSKKPVLNKDLWMQLDEYTQRRDITWTWIKAHQSSDNVDAIYNNMADELATSAIKR